MRLALSLCAACAIAAASPVAAQEPGGFELELAGFRFREPEIAVYAAPPDRVVFHVLDPAAVAVAPGAIRTTINGEPASTIQTVVRTPTGRSVICDLKRWPRVALRPGRNQLAIRVDGQPHGASFLVFLPDTAPRPGTRASASLVAHERRRVRTGADTEPPTLSVSGPPERIDVPLDQPARVVVQGTANDNRGVASVSIDGVPATLNAVRGARASAGAMVFRHEIAAAPGATQVAVEAVDGAGNLSRVLLRIARTLAPTP